MTGDRIRLDGRRALVTGAASGIGLACVHRLVDRGAQVEAWDVDPEGLALAAVAGARTTRVDLRDDSDLRRAFDRLDGIPDAAALCAGIGHAGSLRDTSPDDWDMVHGLNLRAVFQLLRLLLPALGDGGGSLVVVASELALIGRPNVATYAASKAGLLGLVRSLATEAAADGVRVNAVAPGATMTPMLERDLASGAETAAAIASTVPLGRIARPDEIAAAIAFLLSDDASFITGHTLVCDGGLSVS